MIDAKMFDMLVLIGEHFGYMKGYPFGGIQVHSFHFSLSIIFLMFNLKAYRGWRLLPTTSCSEGRPYPTRFRIAALGQGH